MKFYAGIGSRGTPMNVLQVMSGVAAQLAQQQGFVLRSGHASGADLAFEKGAAGFPCEIYLPWIGFSGGVGLVCGDDIRARKIAEANHPNWPSLSRGARALHTRNVFQILGQDLATPSAFVLCWTPDGTERETTIATGGTGRDPHRRRSQRAGS